MVTCLPSVLFTVLLICVIHETSSSSKLSNLAFCKSPTFFIEREDAVEGKLIEKFPTSKLNECAAKCLKNKKCTGANYLLNLESKPYCLMVDSSRPGLASETPPSKTMMYGLTKFCGTSAEQHCEDRSWSFQKFAHFDLRSSQFVVATLEDTSLEDCLVLCQESANCESALYSPLRQLCRLSKITVQNVNSIRQYFVHADDVDLYECNCPKRHVDMHKCDFLRVNHAGFTDLFDVRLPGVKDTLACEHECVQWEKGICRSYTYNASERFCYLSHLSHHMVGRNVLDTLDRNLSSGNLDECTYFNLNCKSDSLTLSGHSMRLFKGTFRSKREKKVACERNVTESYEFSANIPFEECALERQYEPFPVFTGTILVKEGSTDLITVRDKMIQVSCRMHREVEPAKDSELTFEMHVEDGNKTVTLAGSSTTLIPQKPRLGRARYRLEVLDKTGKLADIVDVGDRGYLLITVTDSGGGEAPKDFTVSELAAEDGSTGERMELIDEQGCVVNTSIVRSLNKPRPNQLQIEITFSGFPDQAQVTYQSLVKPCHQDCSPACNRNYWVDSKGKKVKPPRPRRALPTIVQDGRRMELVEDLYEVRSRGRVRMMKRLEVDASAGGKHSPDAVQAVEVLGVLSDISGHSAEVTTMAATTDVVVQVESEQVRSTFSDCVWRDKACRVSMLLAALQFIVMLVCSYAVYTYLKHCYRKLQAKRREVVRYEYASSAADHVSDSSSSKQSRE